MRMIPQEARQRPEAVLVFAPNESFSMKTIICGVLAGLFIVSVSLAQMPGGPPPDPCAALAVFLNTNAEFTATAKVVTSGRKSRGESMELKFAVSGKNMRNEIDMTKASGVRSSDIEGMKQMGMDKMIILRLADKQATYMVYPGLQAYCDMPPGKNAHPDGTVAKADVGSEKVGSHPCTKCKLTYTAKDGQTSEALVWEATDMKNFPIQFQTVDEGQTTTSTFTDVKMGKPDAALFQVPESYKKYNSMQEMIMSSMGRFFRQ